MAIKSIIERLGQGERIWAAELLFRATGLALLAAIWPALHWLRALEAWPPVDRNRALEFIASALVLACLWGGLALAGFGARLLAQPALPPPAR